MYMSSTSTTEFYGLTQYVGTDKPSFTDNNEAFRNVDADLHTAVVGVSNQGEAISAIRATVASLGESVVTLQSDLNTEKGKIVNLQNKETLQDAEIADVKADAQNMITAYVEATATSTHAYSVGDYFIYNDVLYKATDTIAIGDTIVPDTNCTTDNVTTELLAINTALSDKNKFQLGTHATLTTDVEYNVTADGYLYLNAPSSDYVAVFIMDMNNPQSAEHFIDVRVNGSATDSAKDAIFVKKGMVLKKQGGSGTAEFIPFI